MGIATPAERAELDEREGRGINAHPAAIAIAEREKVDLREIEGTGKGGKILKGDVTDYLAAQEKSGAK